MQSSAQAEAAIPRDNIAGFNGIRALAVIAVVLTHLHVYLFPQAVWALGPSFALEGTAGVQAFFALSGFLITTLLLKEVKATGQISIRNFYIRRCLRIFPLYFVVIGAVTLVRLAIDHQVALLSSIAAAAVYLTNFIPKRIYSPVIGHTWSLAVEEHFYFVWPFVVLMAHASTRRLLKWLVGFIAASLLLTVVLFNWTWLTQNFFVERWTPVAGINIAIGCLFAVLLGADGTAATARRIIERPWFAGLAVLLWAGAGYLQAPWWVMNLARGFGLAMFVPWVFVRQKSAAVRILEIKPLQYIGMVSYGVYMWQGFFLSTGPARAPGQVWPPSPGVGLALLLVTVPLSFHFFERPIQRLKHRLQRSSAAAHERRGSLATPTVSAE